MLTRLTVPTSGAGQRLDHFLQASLPAFSRSRLQAWVREGLVTVNGARGKPSSLLRGGELVEVTPAALPPLHATPEDLPVEVLYEDAAVIAVNKPAGMTVHAGAGRHSGTLVNALLHRFGALSTAGGELRPGIVHRLDRLTSGVVLVARTDAAHRALAGQFASRKVEKTYIALVHGRMPGPSGEISLPIARDPIHRTRMTASLASGRHASTTWRVVKSYPRFSLLEVKIATGRTHQIRVHLRSIGHAVAGDRLYGAPAHPSGRFFLHAARITFLSPATLQPVTVSAPLPPELEHWLEEL